MHKAVLYQEELPIPVLNRTDTKQVNKLSPYLQLNALGPAFEPQSDHRNGR